MSAQVELHALGFVVTVEGRPWPKTASTLPARLLTFESRTDARAFADAVDSADAAACHELIERRGRWWAAESQAREPEAVPPTLEKAS